jgi:glycosyltransferase involved in cell wall biosynthesis
VKPRISVIIPVYNGEDFLRSTLEAVFAQDYPAHEVIVVDDGSKDSTPEIIQSYGSRIVSRRIANSGPSVARNEGMKLVTGDWIAFLDADDLWFRNKLKRQAEMAEKFPDIEFICCDYAVRYDFLGFRMTKHFSILKNRHWMRFDEPLKENAFKLIAAENFIGTPSMVIVKKTLTDKVGPYEPKYVNSQDFDYWLRCAVHSNMIVMSEVLLYKRTHTKNLSGNKLNHYSAHKLILEATRKSHADYIRTHGLGPTFNRALAETDYDYADAFYESGQVIRAFAVYWEGFLEEVSPANFLVFLKKVSKKILRLLTFGLLSRKKLKAAYRSLQRR